MPVNALGFTSGLWKMAPVEDGCLRVLFPFPLREGHGSVLVCCFEHLALSVEKRHLGLLMSVAHIHSHHGTPGENVKWRSHFGKLHGLCSVCLL